MLIVAAGWGFGKRFRPYGLLTIATERSGSWLGAVGTMLLRLGMRADSKSCVEVPNGPNIEITITVPPKSATIACEAATPKLVSRYRWYFVVSTLAAPAPLVTSTHVNFFWPMTQWCTGLKSTGL
jgi:hypothetical protein